LRFCPRIRGVQHQRIYRIDPNCDYGSLASLVSRADQTIDTEQIAEQWDRMGQLYASLKTGHVTASVALKRLVGFSAKNRFYRANRDLGRISSRPSSSSSTSRSRDCAAGSDAACSKSSNSTLG
jgi:TnpA family transposase